MATHILIFPGPTQGHINGMMNFARYLLSCNSASSLLTRAHDTDLDHDNTHDGSGNGINNTDHILSKTMMTVTIVHSARNFARLCQHRPNSIIKEQPTGSIIDGSHTVTGHGSSFIDESCSTGSHGSCLRIEVLPDGLVPAPDGIYITPPIYSSENIIMERDLTMQEYFASLRVMADALPSLLSRLKEQRRPVTCLISDTLLLGTQAAADRFGIPRVDFWTSTAACFCSCLHLPILISHGFLPLPDLPDIEAHLEHTKVDVIPGIPPFPLAELTKQILTKDLAHPWIQFMQECFLQVPAADRVFIHTFDDIEGHVLKVIQDVLGLPVHPVGPLYAFDNPGEENKEPSTASLLPEDKKCLGWLDRQELSSVIYVSFGSCATLSLSEIQELALGLEASEQPFILVLRPASHLEYSLEDVLPDGYASRIVSRGIVTSWAPQKAVLAHPAVGGFMTHCGWNSTMEGMWMGVPLLGCPRGSEQTSNMRHIAKVWKNGLTLERGKGSLITKEAVERGVRRLMVGEEGKEARRRAMELKDKARKAVAEGGSSREHLDQFVRDMIGRWALQMHH